MQFIAPLARPLTAAFLGAILLAGCNESTDPNGSNGAGAGGGGTGGGGAGPATATFRVLLTDAPSDQLDSAVIYISQVYLQGDSGRTIVSDSAMSFDLLVLANGVTAELADSVIPTGEYQQLRLIVDSARAVLKAPLTFRDGSTTASMKVPSGSTSGLKVKFGGPIVVDSGEVVVVIDFDVSRSFVFQGPPWAPKSVSLKPVINGTYRNVAGSISGTVTPAAARAQLFAIRNGTDTARTTFADTMTGVYTLQFMPPGTWTVVATAAGYGDEQVIDVVVGDSEAVTGVDLTFTPNGSISGTVTPATSMATLFAIVGVDTLSTTTADATTGAYTLAGLLPNTYSVAASATGFQPAQVDNVAVAASETVTGVDFTLSP
ncbi:MAG: DUF4382 domain-containing protein [Gemmatimonadetes bacterium]|nr:DUF4382 domain-containing protein [Gemmatimonadota bacterium]